MEQSEPVPVGRRERTVHGQRFHCGPLEVETRLDGGRAVVRLTGELDIFSVRELAAALGLVQRRAPDPGVLFLLDGLAFCDSSGLGVLVGTFKRAKAAGGAVALVAVPGFLVKMLRITGLAGLLPYFPTFEEGRAWLERAGRGDAAHAVCGPPPEGTGRTPAGVSAENTREGVTTTSEN